VISGALEGFILPITKSTTLIGSGPLNQVVLPGEGVSQSHARLSRRDGEWWLADLGSSFGTYVGDQAIEGEQPIVSGALVRFGQVETRFNIGGRRRSTRKDLLVQLEGPPASRIRQWIRRYGLSEALGAGAAIFGSWALDRLTGNAIAAAYGATIAESLAFYSLMWLREVVRDAHAAGRMDAPYGFRSAMDTTRKLALEFGPAEVVDSAFIRPLLIGLGTLYLGRDLGVLAGKLLSDVAFYFPVILTYEWRRKRALPGA
jgi:hypothetical protein